MHLKNLLYKFPDTKAGDPLCWQAARDPGSPGEGEFCGAGSGGEREGDRGNKRGEGRAGGEDHVRRNLPGSEERRDF